MFGKVGAPESSFWDQKLHGNIRPADFVNIK